MSRPQHGTRLTGPTGNNAFAYEQRKRTDPDPKLRLPDLKTIASIEEIELATFPTFAELDDYDNVITYTGLKHIYQMDVKNYVPTRGTIPIYIFDNHNYALYFWATYLINDAYIASVPVIHIDQHSDLGTPLEGLPMENMDVKNYVPPACDIAYYTTHICNVGNFIRPALDAGIISNCLWIKNQYDLEQFDGSYPPLHEGNYILDIDLDFRAPEMGTDLTKSIPLVQSLMRKASCITIASSPYFLDQHYALELLKRLFSG